MQPTRPKRVEFTGKQASDLQTLLHKQKLQPGQLLLESTEGRRFIASAELISRDTYKTAAGHLYRVEYLNGLAVISRDDKLTEEAQLVMQAQAKGAETKTASAPSLGSLPMGTNVIHRPTGTKYLVSAKKTASHVQLENATGTISLNILVETPVDVSNNDLMVEWAAVG